MSVHSPSVPTLPHIIERKTGESLILLPPSVTARLARFPLVSDLYICGEGYFPCASTLYRARLHGYRDSLLIYCVSGRAWFEIQGRRQTLNPDEILILPAHLPHKYGPHESDPWSIRWAAFNGANAIEYLHQLPANQYAFPVDPAVGPEATRLFANLHTLLVDEMSIARLLCASKMLEHILALLFFHGPAGIGVSEAAADAVTKTIHYMRQRLDRSVALPELARVAHLSVTHFSRVFKHRTGHSPIEYFIHLKVQAACQELVTTDHPVKTIALDLGYEDSAYFSRVFPTVMETPPTITARASEAA